MSSGTSSSSTIDLDHCDLTGAHIKQDAKCVTMNTKNLKAALNTISDDEITNKSKATAEAIGQQISLTTGTKASTDVENTTTLMKNIVNTIQQNVADTMDATMTINCHDSSIKDSTIDQTSFMKMLNNTVMSSSSVVDSVDKIVSTATMYSIY